MNSRYPLVIVLIFLSSAIYSQITNFKSGYKVGFAKGYSFTLPKPFIGKTPTFVPFPTLSESSDSYQDGYSRGFADGLEEFRRSEISSENVNQKKEINYRDAILAYKEKQYAERKEWITSTMNEIHDFLTNKFLNLDAGEVKKWEDEILNFQYNTLYNNGKWRDLTDNSVFTPLYTYLRKYKFSMQRAYSKIKDEPDANK